jgi:hypothetical protein
MQDYRKPITISSMKILCPWCTPLASGNPGTNARGRRSEASDNLLRAFRTLCHIGIIRFSW